MTYTAAKSRPTFTFDKRLEVKDAGLIAADAAWQVGGVDKILDIGSARFEGQCVMDITALEIASGDERYDLLIQGSNSATFASDIVILAALPVGDGSTIGTAYAGSGVDVDDAPGRYVLPFSNERNNIYYRYLRGFTVVTGAIATGINFSAFVAKDEGMN
jgi:hypothetical protein